MSEKEAQKLEKGDKILYNNLKLIVEKIEVSNIGKHGKAKCRIEALDEKNEKKVFITLADEKIILQ